MLNCENCNWLRSELRRLEHYETEFPKVLLERDLLRVELAKIKNQQEPGGQVFGTTPTLPIINRY